MKTFSEITEKKIPHDASGIDNPSNWLWSDSTKSSNILWTDKHKPKVRIVSRIELQEVNDKGNNGDIYRFEVTCISAINKDTKVADYDTFNCDYKPLGGESGLESERAIFDWLWNGNTEECPPYWEEVEEYIESEYVNGKFDTKPSDKYVNTHLINMVAIVDELEGVNLIDLERDMPSLYEQFVNAKAYATILLKRSSLVLLFPLLFASCQRDTTPTISNTEWETMEVINDLQDAKEWLLSDMEDGRIDSTHGYTYLMILDESIDNLINLPKTK